MPNKVLRFAIWDRLVARFSLESMGGVAPKTLGDEIVPVTNVDDLLLTPTAQDLSQDLSGTAASYLAAFTVPKGERWHLRWAWRRATTAAGQMGFVVNGVNIRISVNEITEQAVNLGSSIVLVEGDTFGAFTTGNAGDNARPVRLMYMIETIALD